MNPGFASILHGIDFWALVLGSSLAAGLNLYLVGAGLGIAARFGLITLPGDLQVLSEPLVIAAFVLLYAVEFFADKIPVVDSIWDTIHTLIRPLGGALVAYLALSNHEALSRSLGAVMGGTLALQTHLMKAGTRAVINTSPEPFTNWAASFSEDALVFSFLALIIYHPVIMIAVVLLVTLLAIWLLPKLWRLLKRISGTLFSAFRRPEAGTGSSGEKA